MTPGHLTDEQFGELTLGESPGSEARAHLEACEACRAELRAVTAGIRSFSSMGMLWAEQRAPGLVPVPSRWSVRLHAVPRWAVPAAALAIFAAAVGFHPEHRTALAPEPAIVAETAPAPSSNVLAEDNRLMMSIDQELNSDVHPQVPVSELQARGTGSRRGNLRRFVD